MSRGIHRIFQRKTTVLINVSQRAKFHKPHSATNCLADPATADCHLQLIQQDMSLDGGPNAANPDTSDATCC